MNHLLQFQIGLFVLIVQFFSLVRKRRLQLLDLNDRLVNLLQTDDQMLTRLLDLGSLLRRDLDLHSPIDTHRTASISTIHSRNAEWHRENGSE